MDIYSNTSGVNNLSGSDLDFEKKEKEKRAK